MRILKNNLNLCKSHRTSAHPLTFQEELEKKSNTIIPDIHTSSRMDRNTKINNDVQQYKTKKIIKKYLLKETSILNAIELTLDIISKKNKKICNIF